MPKKSEKTATKRASTSTGRKKAVSAVVVSPPELIARRAYELFVEQGGAHGRDLDHWLAAEAELRTIDK